MCRNSNFVMLSKLPIEEGNEPPNFIEGEIRLISLTLPKVADPARESHFIPERSKYQRGSITIYLSIVFRLKRLIGDLQG